MKKDVVKSENYEECYVAFIDLLGFKNIVKTLECKEIYSIFEEIKDESLIQPIRFCGGDSNYNLPLDKVQKYVMSDSVIFYINIREEYSLAALIKQVSYSAQKLLRQNLPILMRGGISKGALFIRERIIYGPALNEAYELQEDVSVYPRIVLANTIDITKELPDMYKESVYNDFDDNICVEYIAKMTRDMKAKCIEQIDAHCSEKEKNQKIQAKRNYVKRLLEKN